MQLKKKKSTATHATTFMTADIHLYKFLQHLCKKVRRFRLQ